MRILLCTDGSSHGQAALRFGALVARGAAEPAVLLGVVEASVERAGIEAALQAGRGWLAGAPEPEIRLRAGHAAEQILEEASSGRYDLVVVGTRGRRGITRFLLGSTAERIVRHAVQPVLLVQGARERLAQMLVCTAGGEPGLAAVEEGGRVARLAGAEVGVLHVMSQVSATPVLPEASTLKVMPQTPAPPDLAHMQFSDLEARAEELIDRNTREGVHLQKALDLLADLGVPARALVRHGLVLDEILAEANVGDYDLVVVGAHPAEGWMRFLLNNLQQQIIDYVGRPVLVVKIRPR